MKEIFLILSMLVLGLFSAKAFGTYIPTPSDTTLLAELETKIDSLSQHTPSKVLLIQDKLPPILTILDQKSQARYILDQLLLYIQNSSPSHQRSPELLATLSNQFQ